MLARSLFCKNFFWEADDDDEYTQLEYELSHEERKISYESNEPYQVLLIIECSFGKFLNDGLRLH